MKKKCMKSFLIALIGILTITSIVFIIDQQQTSGYNSGDPGLSLHLYGPYGQILNENASNMRDGTGSSTTRLTLSFKEQTSIDGSDINYTRDGTTDYCGEGGGEYTLEYNLKVPFKGGDRTSGDAETIFECATPKDVLKQIKIPEEWEDDELLVYCAEGGKNSDNIKVDTALSSFLLSQISENYAGCLVNNQDVENGTLFYGFPYGNVQLERQSKQFYEEDAEDPFSILSNYENTTPISINDYSSMMSFNRSTPTGNPPREIFLSYFDNTKHPHYILSNSNESINNQKPLIDVFKPEKIQDNTSRTIMLRNFQEGRKIYGFQSQERMISDFDVGENKMHPLYFIHYDGFGNIQDLCEETLAAYEPQRKNSGIPNNEHDITVLCYDSEIMLRTKKLNFDESYDDLSFTLFKNIITDANGEGGRTSSSDQESKNILERPDIP